MGECSPAILFLVGASGAGKTTIVQNIQAHNINPAYQFFYSDAQGVPSFDEMLESSSLERYQELLTHHHIKTITQNYPGAAIVVFEGQARFNFIEDACKIYGVNRYNIILIDCPWKNIRLRLLNERQQPELVNFRMRNWSKFLRQQAREKNISIIDTSKLTLEQSREIILTHLSNLANTLSL
jgi:GTPase SAR1 family protein